MRPKMPDSANDPNTDHLGVDLLSDPSQLLKLAEYRMPFGKYANRLLIDLPEPYVIWFANKGFPQGELGQMMAIVHEIKVNGLEFLFQPLRKTSRKNQFKKS